jgi:hypothetical protein
MILVSADMLNQSYCSRAQKSTPEGVFLVVLACLDQAAQLSHSYSLASRSSL